MNGNGKTWTIRRVRGKNGEEKEDSETIEVAIEICPICGAEFPQKVCDDCKNPLIHDCGKQTLAKGGIEQFNYFCSNDKQFWFMKCRVIKK